MEIELHKITIRQLTDGYEDKNESGVTAFGGKLDVRPPYQREFVYKEKQRDAVIDTVVNGFPLNVMYWATRDDGTYEIIDGQQRTISRKTRRKKFLITNFKYTFAAAATAKNSNGFAQSTSRAKNSPNRNSETPYIQAVG